LRSIESVAGAIATIACLALLFAMPANSRAGSGQAGATFSMATIRDRCIAFDQLKEGRDYRECRVSEFDEIGTVDSERYYYAIYCLMAPDAAGRCGGESAEARYYRERAVAIFTRRVSSERAQLMFARADEDLGIFSYEKPRFVQTPAGLVLEIPIVVDGTGHGNATEYYLRASGAWMPIESEAWTADLQKRLPDGLQIWKGVWPDLGTMSAETGLYRDGDANCCPTGGTARIHLAIRERRFVIDSLVIDRPP